MEGRRGTGRGVRKGGVRRKEMEEVVVKWWRRRRSRLGGKMRWGK